MTVVSLEEAVELVPDGSSIGTGGILMTRKPVALLNAVASVRRDLTLWTLLGSLDAELLAAHGALAASNTIYVGFEQLGFAPAYSKAVADGSVDAREYSELLMLAGLRASLAGLPFLPTRGAQGSDVATALRIETITCPYSGETLFAAPAIRPDVALLHATAADAHGNVAGPVHRDFLFDWDANIARASTPRDRQRRARRGRGQRRAAVRARGRRDRGTRGRRTAERAARRVSRRPGARRRLPARRGGARMTRPDTRRGGGWPGFWFPENHFPGHPRAPRRRAGGA